MLLLPHLEIGGLKTIQGLGSQQTMVSWFSKTNLKDFPPHKFFNNFKFSHLFLNKDCVYTLYHIHLFAPKKFKFLEAMPNLYKLPKLVENNMIIFSTNIFYLLRFHAKFEDAAIVKMAQK